MGKLIFYLGMGKLIFYLFPPLNKATNKLSKNPIACDRHVS